MRITIANLLPDIVRSEMLRTICVALFAATAATADADMSVGASSSVDFADADIDFACGNLAISGSAKAASAGLSGITDLDLSGGSFAPGGATLDLGGSFDNAGIFVPGTSAVRIGDTCGTTASTFSGATNFYDLSIVSASGKRAIFPVGLAQTIAHALTLQGSAAQLLGIASSTAGQRGVLALANGAAQSIGYVNARDNQASIATIAPGAAASYQSIDGGNLINWFANASGGGGGGTPSAVPAPALGAGRWLLIAALLMVSLLALPGRRKNACKNSSFPFRR